MRAASEIKKIFHDVCIFQGWDYTDAKIFFSQYLDSPEKFDPFFKISYSQLSDISKQERIKILIEVFLS
jgi:hypothetical protein